MKHLSSVEFLHAFQNENSPNLVNLSLLGCKGIDDEMASVIAQLFPQIHVLTLAFVDGITDSGIEIILKNCSSLHYLDLFAMRDISGSSFTCIPQYAHNLNYLLIEDVHDIGREEYLNVLKSNSKVQVHRTHTWKSRDTFKCKLLQ